MPSGSHMDICGRGPRHEKTWPHQQPRTNTFSEPDRSKARLAKVYAEALLVAAQEAGARWTEVGAELKRSSLECSTRTQAAEHSSPARRSARRPSSRCWTRHSRAERLGLGPRALHGPDPQQPARPLRGIAASISDMLDQRGRAACRVKVTAAAELSRRPAGGADRNALRDAEANSPSSMSGSIRTCSAG